MASRPTLLNSCAYAATAAEARFRIDSRQPRLRSTRVVALDEAAASLVRELAQDSWQSARFLIAGSEAALGQRAENAAELVVSTPADEVTTLATELADADFVMMIATADDGAAAAAVIGLECALRGIMTAAVVLGPQRTVQAAVRALRPNARVLLISNDWNDVAEILSAVGA